MSTDGVVRIDCMCSVTASPKAMCCMERCACHCHPIYLVTLPTSVHGFNTFSVPHVPLAEMGENTQHVLLENVDFHTMRALGLDAEQVGLMFDLSLT